MKIAGGSGWSDLDENRHESVRAVVFLFFDILGQVALRFQS